MKKAGLLLVTGCLSLLFLCGCQAVNKTDSSFSASLSESSVSSVIDRTDFLSWNLETWNSATETEKSACALAYYNYLMGLFGNSEKSDHIPDNYSGDVRRSLNTIFESMEGTSFTSLKEIIDASSSQNTLMGNHASGSSSASTSS